ncbi:MAG: L-serine ammonia-lyase, iron-sulfur-dependent subunit beta [Clostridia bacterium]|nr:L-serine ammonia-lyase, iron-sulfur-dependent subunit beta [Clostridia bacterium]
MNIFDIIGPIMIGPSSSHTAGVVRIAKITSKLLGETIVKAKVYFSGSFTTTYKGHGSDKAVMGGLLGYNADDIRIRDSKNEFIKRKTDISFDTEDLSEYHPNTVKIEVTGESGKRISVIGCSVGGGSILIRRINQYEVQFDATYNTLIIPHNDISGLIAFVARVIAEHQINIANMKVFRSERGGKAIMIIETDQLIGKEIINQLQSNSNIFEITYLEPIE